MFNKSKFKYQAHFWKIQRWFLQPGDKNEGFVNVKY